jgi:hypothetical protein
MILKGTKSGLRLSRLVVVSAPEKQTVIPPVFFWREMPLFIVGIAG